MKKSTTTTAHAHQRIGPSVTDDEWDENNQVILVRGGEHLPFEPMSESPCVAPNKPCQRGTRQQQQKKNTPDKSTGDPLCKNSINANAVE